MIPRQPKTTSELLERAQGLAGLRLADLAMTMEARVPADLRRNKGWVGGLIEYHLGAAAGSQSLPDFPELGIELKTIPIGPDRCPTESTFISVVPQINNADIVWHNSAVRAKLQRVLWVPVEATRSKPLGERQIGAPLLWAPSTEEERVLQGDFDELMELICLGETASISAHHGTWLQVRPKGANARARTPGVDPKGKQFKTLPLGFYLRREFTALLLKRYYAG